MRLALLLVAAVLTAPAAGLPKPKLQPVPTNEEHARLIREGIALHDRGDYEAAIRKYEQVLNENPYDVLAIYETSYAYFASKDFRNCIAFAEKGAHYQSRLLSGFYLNMGSCYDEVGERETAVKIYRAGIKKLAFDPLLHFNLGLTLVRMRKDREAKSCFQQAVLLNPDHASSHLALAELYARQGYPIPATLAVCRFLVLEPASRRSVKAIQLMNAVVGQRVRKKADNEITILMDADPKTDEGDFSGVELGLAMSAAVKNSAEDQGKSEADLLVAHFGTVFAILQETAVRGRKPKGFARAYYAPYFAELSRQDFEAPFVYHAFQAARMSGAAEWIAANEKKVEAFLEWSKGYSWSKDLK